MYEEINQQLEEARQGIFRTQKINSMLEELQKQKKSTEKKTAELKEILDKEDVDVEKLEGKGLAHIFHSILGNLEEQKAKERQEALAARLKYDQAVRELESVNTEITRLTAERAQYEGTQATYQKLYATKKEQLLCSNSETAQRILDLSEKISSAQNTLKEINEAISAGSDAMSHLNSAMDSLNKAEGWGTWDLFGGGLMTDLIKHSHIDDAKSEAEETQMALSRFRTELADVRIDSNISIEIGGFAKFADFFFDGLIADWCMQSRINESQDSVDNVRGQVQMVMNKLSSMNRELIDCVEKLSSELNEQVLNA